ncbi:MAG: diaminopimelate decarboxylase [Alphaproteobacteria bacterium]
MTEFAYRQGVLNAEEVPLPAIAESVGTPFYCYSTAALAARYASFSNAFAGAPGGEAPLVCFALKANSNLAVVHALAQLGAGADVVSEGELRIALAAGVAPGKIVFSGVGKTEGEIGFALETGILQLNVESVAELVDMDRVAARLGRRAPVALRINPDVETDTHAKIATGKSENKFGIDLGHAKEAYARAASLAGIDVQGLAVHIGSQLTSLEPFRNAFGRLARLVAELRADGLRVARLDLGGGLGITYRDEHPPEPSDYAAMIAETLGHLGCEIVLEPGRYLVAEAGVLVTRVIRLKDGITHRFVIVDAAMNDLVRPALYDAYHGIRPVEEPDPSAAPAAVEVVGPVCETGDTFARERTLPPLAAGDLLAISAAGAYGAVMASTYNARLLVPEVMVKKDRFAVIRPRPGYEDLLGRDRLPDWEQAKRTARRLKEA